MEFDYKSVIEQAGIYAGTEGFDITVGGNTHLKGAVIASEASTEKNTLATGTLSWEDIANEADCKADVSGRTVGAAFSHEQNGNIRLKNAGTAPVKTVPVKDSRATTTKSAIADGKIEITDKAEQKQDINTLERNTKDILNRLEKIFDKEDVKEQQELANLFAQFSAEKIGDIAEEKGWAKDDARRALLHGLSGAITAGLAGGSAASGAAAGAAMESLQPMLDNFVKEHPELREEASVVIGGAVGKLVGGDAGIGEAVAWTGTKFNYLLHKSAQKYQQKIEEAGDNEDEVQYYRKRAQIQGTIANELIADYSSDKDFSNVIYSEADFSAGVAHVPMSILNELEEKAEEKTTQIMGKDYYDYKGVSPFDDWSPLKSWVISTNMDLPWYFAEKQIDAPILAKRMGKYGLVSNIANEGINISKDNYLYSGTDRDLAIIYDSAAVVSVMFVTVIAAKTGGTSALIAGGIAGAACEYITWYIKKETLKTDIEKEYDQKMKNFSRNAGEKK